MTDENDAPTANDDTFSVAENSATGTAVGTVVATDPDLASLSNGTLTYAIASNTGGVFAINSTTGAITVAGALDYEATDEYTLVVTVADGGSPSLSDMATITITVMDENEASTVSDDAFSVAETSAIGTEVGVGTVTATDPDQTSPNNTLTYAITGGDTGGAFAINSTTGEITVASALDFETTDEYTLEVTVTDGGSPSQTSTATLTITVTDVNEAPTASDAPFSVAENSATGTAVGTVVATDPDLASLSNGTLMYTITGGNTGNVFAINSTTGAMTVADVLDYETTASYSLVVTVTDGGSPSLSSTAMLTITVTDVSDQVPIFTSNASVTVLEGTTTVTTVTARDCKCGTNSDYVPPHADGSGCL